MSDRVTIGTLDELRRDGCLTGKVGTQPICVFWSDGAAYALDDRCPHMGFPLHRGTVESGLVTCHWHNARFDLSSGGTLDPWADDVRAYPVEIDDGRVTVVVEPEGDRTGYLLHRLDEGLEQGITLVIAKAVLGLLDTAVAPSDIVRAGVDFGTRYREAGWGAGLTVLTSMANVLPHLDPADHALALVHGLAFVSRDTRGRAPRFPLLPLGGELPADRLEGWYRRFIETRSADAAERTLASAVATLDASTVADIMFAAVTDHVFLDGGHTIDFTNKAFEVLDHLGWERAPDVLPTLVAQTASASRSEERGSWRFPHDLAGMIATAAASLPERLAAPDATGSTTTAASPSWRGRSCPRSRPTSSPPSTRPSSPGSTPTSSVAPSPTPPPCASPASTSRTITATGTRCTTPSPPPTPCTRRSGGRRRPSCCAASTTARCASTSTGSSTFPRPGCPSRHRRATAPTADLADLQGCWDHEGRVDDAGTIVFRYLRGGGDPASGDRNVGACPAERGRRVPLVPDLRGRRPAVPRVAGGLRGGRPDPRRHGPVPRRPHTDPTGTVPGGPHRHSSGAGRGALRAIVTPTPARPLGGRGGQSRPNFANVSARCSRANRSMSSVG